MLELEKDAGPVEVFFHVLLSLEALVRVRCPPPGGCRGAVSLIFKKILKRKFNLGEKKKLFILRRLHRSFMRICAWRFLVSLHPSITLAARPITHSLSITARARCNFARSRTRFQCPRLCVTHRPRCHPLTLSITSSNTRPTRSRSRWFEEEEEQGGGSGADLGADRKAEGDD